MAILANRVKSSPSSFGLLAFIKFILANIKRFFIIFLLGVSLYLFLIAPKKISNISLEISGCIISTSLIIYENIFEYINSITQKFVYFQDLAKKNMELQLEIARLQRLQSNINSIRAENSALKDLLMVTKEEEFKYITAKLLSASFTPFAKTALIAAGENYGIKPDQIVINAKGLVGKITEVSSNYAKVILVNDINSRIPVTSGTAREKGILAGNNDNGKILYLPNTHLIQKDEEIITSGHGNIYPAGILVGHVTKVIEDEVIVNIAADLSKTEFVQILLPQE